MPPGQGYRAAASALLAACMTVCGCSKPPAPPRTPVRELLESMRDGNLAGSHSQFIEARDAIAAMRDAAVADLVIGMRDDDPTIRRSACEAAKTFRGPEAIRLIPALVALVEVEEDPHNGVQRAAIEALGQVGWRGASEVLPSWIAVCQSGDVFLAGEVLGQIGNFGHLARDAVPTLIAIVDDPTKHDRLRRRAMKALAQIDPESRDVRTSLLAALDDGALGGDACLCLARLESGTDEIVPALIEVLETGGDSAFRAAEALGNLGPSAGAAVPALRRSLSSRRYLLRYESTRALGRMGPAARDAIPVLVHALEEPRLEVEEAAAVALGELGLEPQLVVPALARVVDDREAPAPARYEAYRAIGAFGPAAGSALPVLLKKLRHAEKSRWRECAAMTLGQIGIDRPEVVKALADPATNDAKRRVIRASMSALGDLRTDSKVAVAALQAVSRGSDRRLRVPAAAALAQIGRADPRALRLLGSANSRPWFIVSEDEKELRLNCLSELGPAAAAAVPELAQSLKYQKSPADRVPIAQTILRIEPANPEAGQAMADALTDEDEETRYQAAVALAHLGSSDARVLAELTGQVQRGRLDAIVVLAELGPAAKAAIPVLTEAQRHPWPAFSEKAREAVAKIQSASNRH